MTPASNTSNDSPGRVFLTAEWRDLAMLNYAIDPALVKPFVPRGTEIDFFENRTYISLVAFRFLRTRLLGVSIPQHGNFIEVNLRFYVHRGERRGVVFLREIVPKRAVATLARVAYGENYIALPMSCRIDAAAVEYRWRYRSQWSSIKMDIAGEPALPAPGTHEQFIAEHYWGYSRSREYRVEHEPWRVRNATVASFEGDASDLYGPRFAEVLACKPASAFLADGSPVTVYRAQRI